MSNRMMNPVCVLNILVILQICQDEQVGQLMNKQLEKSQILGEKNNNNNNIK